MEFPLVPEGVDRQGIAHLAPVDIEMAKSQGKRWKLVCSAHRSGESIVTRVAPEMVGMESPMFHAEGTTSVVRFETDVLGSLTIIEKDARVARPPHTVCWLICCVPCAKSKSPKYAGLIS